MGQDDWVPWKPPADDLVWPVRLDPAGVTGPTRGQARGRRWRRSAHGWYVPSSVDPGRVEQRILEQAVRLAPRDAVTGWASLRWRGAAFFDGRLLDGTPRPVELLRLSGARRASETKATISHAQLGCTEIETVRGIVCATVQRSLFDEMRFAPTVRGAVVAVDMAAAAGLISPELMAEYVAHRHAWEGVPQVRRALALADARSRSPQESRLRLVWTLDAGLGPPLCNVPVFDARGELLGVPDLLDVGLGLVGEYDGAHHKGRDRHRRDVAREQRFRDQGLELVTVVGGDLSDRALVVGRILAAARRARTSSAPQGWTLRTPPWWDAPESLDARLRRTGRTAELTHT
ncbi:hypothetical protein [Nocardioides sp.]|uniref:hypothetical protein n=1 Tax=Nocardioides sp. TaxID=35761 RepID=UPI00352811A8